MDMLVTGQTILSINQIDKNKKLLQKWTTDFSIKTSYIFILANYSINLKTFKTISETK